MQHAAREEPESQRQVAVLGRKKPPRISSTNRSPASPSNNSPMSPTDVKAKNTGVFHIRVSESFCVDDCVFL